MQTESSRMNAFFPLPAFWLERGSVGLRSSFVAITIGLFKSRVQIVIGRRAEEHNGPLSWDDSGFTDFIAWANSLGKTPISKPLAERWLMASDWDEFIRLGGARYHYGRIILIRDIRDSQSESAARADIDVELDIPNRGA